MKFRPLRNLLVIRRTKRSTTSIGGIDLSGTTQEKPNEGLVIANGPGKRLETGEMCDMSVKSGDSVLFSSHVGVDVVIEGEALVMMSEEDIMGIL